ncbi:hypothetical protein AMATHDRAFT_151008 [Amanita thiersii Skay4041]|uniref:GST N-terminal domain-containing protein n=1 Tax=Amanita thiersii Skay4041 TaxID=703135 RepID=A0A2A9NCX3_9AGAR|nr:hypothetical protein AMATHDRAFT_151008 [Amanita thiersii Skay4041]
MPDTIIFYDIPSILPGNAWSPNTWKVRYALNFKGLPYKTEWIEYPDIKAKCLEIGIKPTGTNTDGSPYYSLPAIYDPNTKTAIADSYDIVLYLERTYPDTPRVMPNGTEALQSFPLYFYALGADTPLWRFTIPGTPAILNPRSKEYFIFTRERDYKSKLEDLALRGAEAEKEWKRIEEAYNKLDGFYQLSGGPYIMGETLSYLDIMLASWSLWIRFIHGENSDKWRDVISWNQGRWGKLIQSLEKYAAIH